MSDERTNFDIDGEMMDFIEENGLVDSATASLVRFLYFGVMSEVDPLSNEFSEYEARFRQWAWPLVKQHKERAGAASVRLVPQ